MTNLLTRLLASALLFGLAFAAACSNGTATAKTAAPPEVLVADVVQRDVPIYTEWIGTLDGLVNADIKAQVSGYLEKQEYTEGSNVKKGQLLFEIDPRPFQAALDQGRAHLAQANGQLSQAKAQLLQAEPQVAIAEANQGRAQLDVERYTPLAKQQASTQQDLDNAVQNNLAAKAQVQAAKAQVETAKSAIESAVAAVQAAKAAEETAQLNLGFTRLVSPIDGVAGGAQQQVGALVGPGSGPVTTVSTLDPIKCNITVSEQEYLTFHRQYDTPEAVAAERSSLVMELILADQSVYPHKGKFYFTDREVNQRTGSIRVAGLFPNHDNTLRPGQYAKIRTSVRSQPNALLVPQRAVSELQGGYQIAVVGADNKVSIRPVRTGDRADRLWIITDGVKPGERVVAEGLQKIRDGMTVTTKPYEAK